MADIPELPLMPKQNFLWLLQTSGKHIYAGTVSAKERARRRAANKVARRSRRAGR